MENDIFSASLSIFNQSHMVLDPASSNMLSGPLIHSGLPGYSSHKQIMAGNVLVSTVQEGFIDSVYIINNDDVTCNDVSISRNVPQTQKNSFDSCIGNMELHEHIHGVPLCAAPVVNLGFSTSVQENLNRVINNYPTSVQLSDEMRVPLPNDSCNTINCSFSASLACHFGAQNDADFLALKTNAIVGSQIHCTLNGNDNSQVPVGKAFSMVCPSYHVMGNSEASWNLDKSIWNFSRRSYNHPATLGNELSLSLGSCQATVTGIGNVPDQCSEGGRSATTEVTTVDSEQSRTDFQAPVQAQRSSYHDFCLGVSPGETIQSGKELSLFHGSSGQVRFSNVLLASKYLHVAQQILSEFVTCTLGYPEMIDDSTDRFDGEIMSFYSNCSRVEQHLVSVSDELPLSDGEKESEGCMKPQKCFEANMTKKELFTLLHLVDSRYNHCLEQVKNVMYGFHLATDSDISNIDPPFAFLAISSSYKRLRERITHQILLLSQRPSSESIQEKEEAFESSFIQKQWALQQLKKCDQQSWRPQRGLPEKSVSVLRQWMFQNFLHPYPKDNDKQLLARESGLTRSQVSNWFINARVRLWKPMIEEMCLELNKKKCEDGSYVGESRSDGSIRSQSYFNAS